MAAKPGKQAAAPVVGDEYLDAILDQALDDFQEQELQNQVAAVQENEEEEEARKAEREAANVGKLQELLANMDDPRFGRTLTTTMKDLSASQEGNATVDDTFKNIQAKFENEHEISYLPKGEHDEKGIDGADRQVAAAMQMLGQAQKGMHGLDVNKMEDAGGDMMEEMMAQFEALGEKEDYNEVIDSTMRQLLSKELMYEPIRQICNKFPEWLALHKSQMSKTEYDNYGKQYMVFQKILAVFDIEPDNFPRLMELMFDIQQYGQPPADIIRDLAPGLKFDENGMPIMPNMGAGMMPGGAAGQFPNMAELANNMSQGTCAIM